MQKFCRQCSATFEITKNDLTYYEKVSPTIGGKKFLIPPPTLCPVCRAQRRHAMRNERNLFHRKCDLTGKQILSVYSVHSPAVVYEHREWWSDKWDPLDYGRDFDFSRPFFEQFGELLRAVPHMNVAETNVENCDYCHLIADSKNCYLVFETSHGEDCMHGYWLQKCENCCDASFSHECRVCYQIDNCYNSQNLRWCRNCTNCSDSSFLLDCIGCRHCLFCVNQRQKEYCIFNKQYSKRDFEQKIKDYNFGSADAVRTMQKEFAEFALSQPRKYMTSVQAENCTGNYVQESKNCIECYHAHQSEDCKYGEHVWRDAKDCMDVVTAGRGANLIYESTNTNMGAAEDAFDIQCWSSSNVLYSSECCSCRNCFGSVCLKQKKYCIFNKQYSQEEYEELVPKIIEHMRKDGGGAPNQSPCSGSGLAMNPSAGGASGSWGEFFPSSISLFSYNESMAQEYFPMTKEEVNKDRRLAGRSAAMREGWSDDDQGKKYMGPTVDIPDAIEDVPDDIATKILLCEATKRPYKIIPQELKFCRDLGIPLPRKSPDERHRERMSLRNPMKLWNRPCSKCQKEVPTTYAPDRTEIIYCEDCYLASVY